MAWLLFCLSLFGLLGVVFRRAGFLLLVFAGVLVRVE
jgi:hypothetical protein